MQIKNNFILTGGNLDDNVFSLKKKSFLEICDDFVLMENACLKGRCTAQADS